MKILKLLLILFLFTTSIFAPVFAQGEEVNNYLFLFGQIGVSSNTTITYTLTAQGTYWDFDSEEVQFPIYRATSSTSTPPSPGSFSYIASVPGDTYEFVDDYYLVGGNFYIHYYVKAKFIPTESFSSATNIASTPASVSYKLQMDPNYIIYGYELNQNYPNPFNPNTKIRYALQEDAKVQIKVYDILGTEVTELVNESKPAGYYETNFDASKLSSGIYIYRITALSSNWILFSQSKQMVLIK